jgi:hypothetical protein
VGKIEFFLCGNILMEICVTISASLSGKVEMAILIKYVPIGNSMAAACRN